MCGIAGFIGQPKKPKLTYELITSLFENLEIRGTDASGVWGTEIGKDSRIAYHKEPIRSSEFIKGTFWKNLSKIKFNLMLVHARSVSKGGGAPNINHNNHPFVSADKYVAMVHNGTLEEANFLKEKYQITSSTDSEYLLRMYEHGLEKEYYEIKDVPNLVAWKLNAIKEIWSVVTVGAMAVAMGEWINEDSRGLFLFRNEKRPLWLADMRKTLGQIFFFSSPDIWYRVLYENKKLKDYCWESQKLCELPPQQVWYLGVDKEDPVVTRENMFKFGVKVTDNGKKWDKGQYCSVISKRADIELITSLDEEEYVEEECVEPPKNLRVDNGYTYSYSADDLIGDYSNEDETEGFQEDMPPSDSHQASCKAIKYMVSQIDTEASNQVKEGSMSPTDYQLLIESLQQTQKDLEGILSIIQS